jgi:hypothetical protein
MPENIENNSKFFNIKSILTDGVLIAIATAFAYFATFVYEIGYCSNFLIPFSLISPNTSTILVAAAAIGSIFVSSMNLLGFTTPLFRRAKKGDGDIILAFTGFFIIALIFATKIYDLSFKQIGYAVLGFLIFMILPIIPIFFSSIWKYLKSKVKKNNTLSQPTHKNEKKEEEKETLSFSVDEFLENWMPQKIVRVFVFFGIVLLIAFIVGDGNASTQKRFLTLKNSPSTAVLRIYGDLMITAPFDREKHEIFDEISLIWLSEKKQMDFFNEEVGPLKMKKTDKTQK